MTYDDALENLANKLNITWAAAEWFWEGGPSDHEVPELAKEIEEVLEKYSIIDDGDPIDFIGLGILNPEEFEALMEG